MQKVSDRKKRIFPAELAYLLALVLLAFAVAMLTTAGFGVSMIVAPAYLVSLKVSILSFGQAEYALQAGAFVLFCVVMGQFRWIYLSSFGTCLLYGAVLDLWRRLPLFDPQMTAPDSLPLWGRLLLFVCGVLLTALSVSLFYKTYLYPQVYDFFVKAVSGKYGIKTPVFKTCFDLVCLACATVMTLVFFGGFKGVSFGTLIMAVANGTIIGLFTKLIDKYFEITPRFKRAAEWFKLD